MRSKARLTSRAVRRCEPLNAMCSRKCDTPDTSGVSSREPVRTKKPRATDRAEGLGSPMICRPLASLWLWKGMYNVSDLRVDRQPTKLPLILADRGGRRLVASGDETLILDRDARP